MKKSSILCVLGAIIIGILIGKYIYGQYKEETKSVFNYSKDEVVYLLQYGVYSTEENMIENAKNLKNCFYYKENDGYHVLIGITKNKKLKQKIVDSYKIKDNIYMKGVKVNNQEFLNLLEQYDSLVESSDDKDTIITSQKQILSKYEELILESE